MHDGPFFLAQLVETIVAHYPRGVGIVGPEPEKPGIAGQCQRRIGAADHHRPAGLLDARRDRLNLGAAGGAEKGDDVFVVRELGEGQHGRRVQRLIVFDHQLERPPQHPAGLVDFVDRKFGALNPVAAGIGNRSGQRRHHADLDGISGLGSYGQADRKRHSKYCAKYCARA